MMMMLLFELVFITERGGGRRNDSKNDSLERCAAVYKHPDSAGLMFISLLVPQLPYFNPRTYNTLKRLPSGHRTDTDNQPRKTKREWRTGLQASDKTITANENQVNNFIIGFFHSATSF